ncbi:MAG TPA: hypothetical protein VKA84_14520 [Gemmatimonadaceae bacterium]|nr:hypothetical protein [Gemmatimonadaceae bacterium]
MTARQRLVATRRALVAAVILRALLWGAAVALLLLLSAGVADAIAALPLASRSALLPAALVVAAAAALWTALRGGVAPSLESVALWVERRVPQLQYALVTAGGGAESSAAAVPLERAVAAHSWSPVVRRAAVRAAAVPLAVAAVAAAGLAALPAGSRARVVRPAPGDALARAPLGTARASRLSPLVAAVAEPAYAGGARRTLDEPTSVAALVGSEVVLRGRGGAGGIGAALVDGAAIPVRADRGGRWAAALPMPARPGAVRLTDGAHERVVVLEPRPDSAPTVSLALPARDTVFRAVPAALQLRADLADDIGLASGAFEYIVSSGEGESFTFRSGTVAAGPLGGVRRRRLEGVLRLDSLALEPGDLVHLRAVARDGNTVSGPGAGVSETRTLRVARVGEGDSVAVEGAPPPEADKSLVSQRMLIILTEALERRRPRLARDEVVAESRRISTDQKRLRKAVSEIIFSRLGEGSSEESQGEEEGEGRAAARTPEEVLRAAEAAAAEAAAGGSALDFEGPETPVLAVNRPLLEAYNAMWDAGRELDVGEPGRALPPMRAALAALQRARAAERIYLRGRPPAVVVDVGRVRLQGAKPDAAAATRDPRAPLDDPAPRRAARFAAAMLLLGARPDAAVDSLLLLRVDALGAADAGGSPALAAALGEAVDRLRAGRDATGALARARRLIAGAPRAADSLPRWSGAW